MAHTLRRRALLGAATMPLLPAVAHAQSDWPNRPVRIIVPFPPGQASDIITRLVADELSKRWPQRVVVENRAGGAGAPALEAGARAAPDGYTLTAGTSGTLGVNPSVLPRVPYDAERDFAAITNVAMVPLLVIAHPSLPANTMPELAAAARANPGGLDMASAGPATSQHMAAELLMLRANIRFNIVHYRGSGPAIADVIAGNVRLMTDSVASALPHIREGRVKAIALCSARRVPQLPDVPTIAETLVPGYQAAGWSGLVAPAGTPAEIIRRINADVVAILRDPAIAARILQMGAVPDPLTPEEYATFIRTEIATFREVARAANVRLEG
ncbi:tripartite tricarboxylate transporter substrate binding protein [Roseomonas sp. PWR1]|uniref:Tripartite tricarboxylate transporter substrate binding protein n=1 Tax=Roseomonas nitratireducens TaxID=2820810 RepID=A0ABS4AVV8_9PROT|nr:tripartite tricarboxylate transporter substrate binding protein [Neoroseomonas nitratireducens]MBP0465503.1 tripartite tricarboxylate transporter substrate binding protein [Neoroseomonas nitratireducens]